MHKTASSQSLLRKALWTTNIQAICPIALSPKQSVPKGNEGGGVEGTDEYEQQNIEAHHDGKMVSEEPGGAAGMSEEEKHNNDFFACNKQNVLIYSVSRKTRGLNCTMVFV